jgi:hypothetical protein
VHFSLPDCQVERKNKVTVHLIQPEAASVGGLVIYARAFDEGSGYLDPTGISSRPVGLIARPLRSHLVHSTRSTSSFPSMSPKVN